MQTTAVLNVSLRMVPATPLRCFQKTDLDAFSFGVESTRADLR
jgi:hypothetical protein